MYRFRFCCLLSHIFNTHSTTACWEDNVWIGICCMLLFRRVYWLQCQCLCYISLSALNPWISQDSQGGFLLPPKGKRADHKCWVKCLVNLIFAYGFWTDSSSLIFATKACCALLRVSGTVSPSTANPVGDITTYKPLYSPGKTLVILYHKPRFHLCTWLYPESQTFHAQPEWALQADTKGST